MSFVQSITAVSMVVGLCALALGQAGPAATQRVPAGPSMPAAEPLVVNGLNSSGGLTLMVDRSAVLSTDRPCQRVSVAQPEVADVNALSPSTVLVTAKKVGATQVILWDERDRFQVIEVLVQADVQALRQQLKTLFPRSNIEISESRNALVLSGRIGSLEEGQQAATIAGAYSPKVVNLLEVAGGQQVMLQVRFAEVSRSAVSELGINAAVVSGSGFGGTNIGQVNPTNFIPGKDSIVGTTPTPQGMKLQGAQTVNPSVTLYGGGQIGSVFVEAFVNALRQNNLLRILAEPNLIAISGQEASFLAGGEFPIPIAQGGTTGAGGTAITIEFREFGVKLAFTPIVLGDGRIRLKVAPEVSDLDFTTAVRFGGFIVPGLSQRKVQTTIELADGQSFAVAGLLNNTVTASKDVVPVLGDMPVIGPLFRSVRYQRKETELVVLVTPRLVAAMSPDKIPALPGENWRHPLEADLFLNQDIGGPATRPADDAKPPRFYGEYGFAPAPAPKPEK